MKDMRPAEGNGLRQRLEVTEVLPSGGVADLGPDGPVGRRLRAIVGTRPLREVLQVRTRRRPFALRVGGVDVAEVALDDTVIVVGGGQRPMQLRRVEVEVQADWVEALEPIVQQLRVSCGLQPARLSKFEAGLLAVGLEIPGSPDLGPTAITPSSTMGELAFAVVRRQLAAVRAKEPGTRLGEDPEELHDMRVATRRLRAALSLFADVLPVRAEVFRQELGWLGRTLGAVRDLDVQLAGMDDLTAATAEWSEGVHTDGHDPLSDLSELLVRERESARADMLAALDSVRWERLAKGLAAMAQQGPARRSVATRVPAVIGMPELVVTRHDAVAKAAKRAKRSGLVTDFHRLRIRCKRLRYSLEFASEVYEGRTGTYVARPHRRAGRARAHAGRRGGPAAPGRPGDRRRALARCDRVRHGGAGRALPPRRRPLPAPAAQARVTRRRASMARPAVPHGGPARRHTGGAAGATPHAARGAAARTRGAAAGNGARTPRPGEHGLAPGRRWRAQRSGAAKPFKPAGMSPRHRP